MHEQFPNQIKIFLARVRFLEDMTLHDGAIFRRIRRCVLQYFVAVKNQVHLNIFLKSLEYCMLTFSGWHFAGKFDSAAIHLPLLQKDFYSLFHKISRKLIAERVLHQASTAGLMHVVRITVFGVDLDLDCTARAEQMQQNTGKCTNNLPEDKNLNENCRWSMLLLVFDIVIGAAYILFSSED